MNLIQKMKSKEGFTSTEAAIADYILKCPEVILSTTTRDIAKNTFTSPTTIVRFCHKLGLDGFPQFKIRLSAEMSAAGNVDNNIDITPVQKGDSLYKIINRVKEIETTAIDETKSSLKYEQISEVISLIDKASEIDLYGSGMNLNVAHEAAYLFMRLGKKANVSEYSNVQMNQIFYSDKGHLAIILSHSGETVRCIETVKILRKKKTKTVCLCGYMNSKLSLLCDVSIYIKPGKRFIDMGPLFFSTSTRYVLYILFAVLFAENYDANMERFEEYIKITSTLDY